MLWRKDRGPPCFYKGKAGGVLHHLSVIVELAYSVPCPPSARRSVISLERARAMPSYGVVSLGQRGLIFHNIKRF